MRLVGLLALLACSGPAPRARPPQPAREPAPPAATARAFRIDQAADLLDGPMAEGAIGDYRLQNEHLVVIVDALSRPGGHQRTGGHIRDLAPRGGRDELRQVFLYLDDTYGRDVVYERARLDEASGAAELHVTGYDRSNRALAIETVYRVEPGRRYLRLLTRVTNRGAERVAAYEVGDVLQWGGTEHFAPGFGTRFHGERTLPWVAGIGESSSLIWATPTGPAAGKHASAWADVNACAGDLDPGATLECARYLVVGGRADVASGLGEVLRLQGAAHGTLAGRMTDATALGGVAGARVAVATADGKPYATAATDGTGAFAVALPPGEYLVSAAAPGRSGPTDLRATIAPGRTAQLDGRLSDAAEVAFEVVDGGAPVAAKLVFVGVPPTPDPRFGPSHRARGAENVVLAPTGKGKVPLPAGRYRVHAAHGPEYTLGTAEIDVAAGRATPVRLELRRVVPTDGYVSADMHQHAAPSQDSAVALEDRVAANLAEHVEVAVATDHDAITDLGPALDRLGARGQLLTIAGDEATTYAVGHFNAWPLTHRAEEPRGGAFRAGGRTAAEIVARFRQDEACRVVQVNHPRIGRIGYFDAQKYLPYAAKLPEGFVDSFDAVEVANGKRTDTLDAVLLDWYTLLRRGLRMTATGNSDTHRIVGEEAGWPRTYVAVPTEDLTKLTAEELAAGIRERRDAIVSAGPFLRVRGNGQPPGATVRARKALDLEVEIWAAPWIDVTRLEIVASGEVVETVPVPPATEPLRLRYRTRVRLKSDGFVVVVARGEKPLDPIVPGLRPFAFSNPIWVDADGRAGWTALPPLKAPKVVAQPAKVGAPAPAGAPEAAD